MPEIDIDTEGVPFWRRGDISQTDLICLKRENAELRAALKRVREVFEIWECEGTISPTEAEVVAVVDTALKRGQPA